MWNGVLRLLLLLLFVVVDDGAKYDNRVSSFKHAYQWNKQYLQTLTLYTKHKLSLIIFRVASYSLALCYDQCRKRKFDFNIMISCSWKFKNVSTPFR